jgi:hypothetical protein
LVDANLGKYARSSIRNYRSSRRPRRRWAVSLGKHPLQLAGDELNDLQRVHRPAGAQSPTVHEFIQIVAESSDD